MCMHVTIFLSLRIEQFLWNADVSQENVDGIHIRYITNTFFNVACLLLIQPNEWMFCGVLLINERLIPGNIS